IAEDRAMICEIPSIVEKELTRAANETSDFVDKALGETVTHYTDEIKTSTKFLKKQVEERKKASRFEKITDVLMRVCCPILAAGTFVLACVVTCIL
ncbi:MAG: hypothetical protein LUD72_12145, partial [Bacteroidales bacterium]|nr:hypothetical protein [Bacteroidales bacterium]